MVFDDNQLFGNVREYCKSKNIRVLRQDSLGHGSDGAVWRTGVPTAVKAIYKERNYQTERECYRRLAGVNIINGLHVPILEGFNDKLKVIEISIVQPPYLLDFGKAWLDRPPIDFYDPQLISNSMQGWRELFGKHWPQVSTTLYLLRSKFGIYYTDPRPGNINFGDDDDDGDWEAEPGVDYSSYE